MAAVLLVACGGDDSGPRDVAVRDESVRPGGPLRTTSTAAPTTTTGGSTTTTVPTGVTGTTAEGNGATTTTGRAPVLTTDSQFGLKGVGPIAGGMTVTEAEAAAGVTIEISDFDTFGGACYFGRVKGLENLYLLIENTDPRTGPKAGVIGRATADGGAWSTISGVKVGSTEAEVMKAYGAKIVPSPHQYVTGGKYLDYVPTDAADVAYRLRFETDGAGKVTEIHAGLAGPATYIEGCA